MKVDIKRVDADGKRVVEAAGKVATYTGLIPWTLPLSTLLNYEWVSQRLEHLCRTVPIHAPWTAKDAAYLDSITLAQWLKANAKSAVLRGCLGAMLRVLTGTEPSEVSMLWWLWFVHQAGGFMELCKDTDGAQDASFVGGAQQLCERMASALPQPVCLSCPVRSIEQDHDSVHVYCDGGRMFTAKYVIIAISPNLVNLITFAPALSSPRSQLMPRMVNGCTIKTALIYPSPWWRSRGYAGVILAGNGPVCYSFEAVFASEAALVGFIGGEQARYWSQQSLAMRRDAIAQQYAALFGTTEALRVLDYLEQDWMKEEFTGGCYFAHTVPGTMSSYYNAIRSPDGRLHFAGTETATEWSGYVEGALQAGERAAAEVAKRLYAESAVIEQVECESRPLSLYPSRACCMVEEFEFREQRYLQRRVREDCHFVTGGYLLKCLLLCGALLMFLLLSL
eukprot:TRINITY_DN2195_c0_g1_i5.p2 TRINITY_DN2195_c0_g1~~TRINITY_DN2195_c0_g1_i5.p2  ORF type:complete len:528 (+),score=69.31 TRINITY_DN2195_c0_g1_i5:237-1586(+)